MHCRKKWILSTLSILFAGVVLTGCGKTIKQKNDSLHIYASGSDVIMDYAVKEFQRRYPDIVVEYAGRKIIEDAEEFYGYNQQLSAQLMSGSGADVFFIQDYQDIDKLIQAGVFADLSEIYDNSVVFQDADFREDIMNADVFDGKRYFLPMEYRLPMMISTREILDETGFHIENCTDFNSFMQESSHYLNSTSYDRRLFRMDISARNCIFGAGYPIVDKGEVVWDIEETRAYFAWFKDIYERGTGEYMFGDLFGPAALREDISVRKSVMEKEYEFYLIESPFKVAINGFPFELPPLKREDFDAYLAYADKVDKIVYWPEWRQGFWTEINHYLKGETSYEEAAKSAKEKLMFYLSE